MLQKTMEKLLNGKSKKDKRMKLLLQIESQSTINFLKASLMSNNNKTKNVLAFI